MVSRQLKGEPIDWERDYAVPLKRGVDTFRHYVAGWYDGRFQDVIFYRNIQANPGIRGMISSILAGYAWDTNNPFVAEPGRRLGALVGALGEAHAHGLQQGEAEQPHRHLERQRS